jgi:hypothetical protein
MEKAGEAVYDLPIDAVRLKTDELLKKYPNYESDILKALNVWPIFKPRGFRQQKIEDLINADDLLAQYSTRETNLTFEEQKKIHKVLVEEVGGEESEYESDMEELSTPEKSPELGQSKPNKRIFKYLKIIDKMVMLPPKKHKDALTLFIELDDTILNTFLCDENFGYMANPSAKDPEHEFFL